MPEENTENMTEQLEWKRSAREEEVTAPTRACNSTRTCSNWAIGKTGKGARRGAGGTTFKVRGNNDSPSEGWMNVDVADEGIQSMQRGIENCNEVGQYICKNRM